MHWCGIVVLAAIISPTAQAAEPESAPKPPQSSTTASEHVAKPSLSPVMTGAVLRNSSQQAFHRGLLPLTDLLEHLALAEEADIRSVTATEPAESTPSTQSLLKAVQPRVQALRQVVRHLESFRQPAAVNWQADVLLAKYILTEAETEVAKLTGDRAAATAAVQTETTLAKAHYHQRVFDAQILGHASVPEVTRAVVMLNVDPTRKRQALQRAVGTTQRWNTMGAGIGRSDQVLQASLQVALWDAQPRSPTLDEPAVKRGLADADRLTARLFAKQRTYFTHGTATLSDLSRTWQTRRQVHLLADAVGVSFPVDTHDTFRRDLDTLTTSAAKVTDRRGRHGSDVEYVHLLTHLYAGDRSETSRENLR